MKTHLKLDSMPLATTDDGRRFTLKALHPADHEIKATRVPGGNRPTVSLQIDYVVDVETLGKDMVMNLVPHPVIPMSLARLNDAGNIDYYHLSNPAFGGSFTTKDDLTPVSKTLRGLFERYRVLAQSATVELIAPTLANQGTITSAQFTMACQPVPLVKTAPSGDAFALEYFGELQFVQQPPSRSDLLVGTTAYTSPAKEGVYVPLKLTTFKWRDTNNPTLYIEAPGAVPSVPANVSDTIYTSMSGFPFYVPRETTSPSRDTVEMSGSVASVTYVQGTSDDASLRIRVRQVIEGIAYPATSYAPLALMPPAPDELALKMYFEISQRMSDGYPASYNDSGRLGQIVRDIGRKIVKFVDPALDILAAQDPTGLAPAALKAVRGVTGGGSRSAIPKSVVDATIAELLRRYPKIAKL